MQFTSYFGNKLLDQLFRGQAYTFPAATFSIGLLTSTRGPRANSTVYALNDTLSLTANDGKTHLYKVTTAGTSAAAQASLFPGNMNEAIVDGTATLTEQTAAMRAGTCVEAAYSGYARANTAATLANWAGTQGAGTTVASTGTAATTTSNNGVVTFGSAPTSGPSFVWASAVYDATTGGNMMLVSPLTAAKTVNSGDPAPTIAAAGAVYTLDN